MSTKPKPSTKPTASTKPNPRAAELRAEVARARAELASTLDALEYKANLPKRMTARLRKLGEENPAALIGLAAAAAAVAGTAVWLGARAVLRR